MSVQIKYHQTPEQISAEEVMILSAQVDAMQFEPLYKTYYPRILAFVYQRIDSKEVGYDITAQVFYKALNNLKKYKSQGVPFSAWLFGMAINEVNRWYKQSKADRTVNIDEEGLQNLSQEIERDTTEDEKILFKALHILDKEEIEVIDMRFFENRSFKEICEITGMGESACKMKVYRALDKLKKELKKSK